ncbi:MAG: MarR family transcriptional regulator [Acetobacteraceae bacterium]|nr:MAG: MarR family transcriptional regulator [Acetobacteraceae bacterium]
MYTRLRLRPGFCQQPCTNQPQRVSRSMTDAMTYRLDDQIGYLLRRVTQRHLAIFASAIPEVTTTQFAVLARLNEIGPVSQNHLGRATAMDAATIKGVVDRLAKLGMVATTPDPADRRRLTVSLTDAGQALFRDRTRTALAVSEETVSPLTPDEALLLKGLLLRLT